MEPKSCYNCEHYHLCFFRHNLWDLFLRNGTMIKSTAVKETYEVIGANCNEYKFKKEE